MSPLGTVFNIQ